MKYRIAATAVVSCILLTAQSKLMPVDESAADPQFSKFYQAFRAAVSQKDAKALLSFLDPEVQSEIDGDKGPKAFEKRWHPSDSESKLWTELATIAGLGGSFSTEQGTKMFCAPYTYSKFPGSVDSFDHAVVLGANVELRSQPSPSSPLIGKLSHDIVKVPSWEPGSQSQWIRVVTRAGAGYVRTTEIRSPNAFRACFHRKNGRWLLLYLIAGD